MQVQTPVKLLCSLSDYYFWERYGLNSAITVLQPTKVDMPLKNTKKKIMLKPTKVDMPLKNTKKNYVKTHKSWYAIKKYKNKSC